jgi:hypothetical protein
MILRRNSQDDALADHTKTQSRYDYRRHFGTLCVLKVYGTTVDENPAYAGHPCQDVGGGLDKHAIKQHLDGATLRRYRSRAAIRALASSRRF